jgi:hypothetical protein
MVAKDKFIEEGVVEEETEKAHENLEFHMRNDRTIHGSVDARNVPKTSANDGLMLRSII